MRRAVGLLVVACCMALVACSGGATGERAGFVEVALFDGDGRSVSVGDLDDEVVLVNFWASYCKPCAEEMPLLQDLSEEYLGRVRFVGINALDERDAAAALLERTGVSFDVWYDDRGDAMFAAGVASLPATFILDESGAVRYRVLGEVERDALRGALDAAVAG